MKLSPRPRSVRVVLLMALGWLVLSQANSTFALEPIAAFAVKDGWVKLVIEQDGRPVADAKIFVWDEHGHEFAEGETGARGKAEFPLPTGSTFTIEIKIGNRVADPIRLTKAADHVVPAEVLLSFGLKPCCRIRSVGGAGAIEPVASTDAPPRRPYRGVGVAVVVLLGGAILILTRRPKPATTSLPGRKPDE